MSRFETKLNKEEASLINKLNSRTPNDHLTRQECALANELVLSHLVVKTIYKGELRYMLSPAGGSEVGQ